MKRQVDNVHAGETEALTCLITGIDSLYVSYDVGASTSDLDFDQLAYLKDRARRDRTCFEEIDLGTERFALLPSGRKPYAYILKNRDFEVALTETMQPACFVRFFSEALWLQGVEALTNRVAAWQRSVGLLPLSRERITRCDWAFDYFGPDMDIEPEHFVSRAAKDACWRENGAVQTIQLGVGDAVVRFYDKVAEIEQQSAKDFMFELWGKRENVWRIEFQVRRQRLKKAGIRTLADLTDHQGDLLRELSLGHTSLRRPSDDSNRSRWPLHPLWRDLRAQIASMDQYGLIADIDDKAPLEWRKHRMGKSLLGHMKALGVLEYLQSDGSAVPDLEWVLDALPDILRPHHDPIEWESDLKHKIKAEGFDL